MKCPNLKYKNLPALNDFCAPTPPAVTCPDVHRATILNLARDLKVIHRDERLRREVTNYPEMRRRMRGPKF